MAVSPLLFATALDTFIRTVTHLLPHITIRAFADDTAVVVGDVAILPRLLDLFEDVSVERATPVLVEYGVRLGKPVACTDEVTICTVTCDDDGNVELDLTVRNQHVVPIRSVTSPDLSDAALRRATAAHYGLMSPDGTNGSWIEKDSEQDKEEEQQDPHRVSYNYSTVHHW